MKTTINIRLDEKLKKELQAETEKMEKKIGIKLTLSEYIRLVISKRLKAPR